MALLNLVGIIPLSGDAATVAKKVGTFLAKHTYDIGKMTEVLLFVARNCPDALKYLGKQDEVLSYVRHLKA